MLEQIKKAVDEFDALDIERKVLLTKSDALHKQLDKLRMDRYNHQCRLDKFLSPRLFKTDDPVLVNLLANIADTNVAIKETEKAYHETRKEYSHTWPKADLARKKVEKLRKKFWEQKD